MIQLVNLWMRTELPHKHPTHSGKLTKQRTKLTNNENEILAQPMLREFKEAKIFAVVSHFVSEIRILCFLNLYWLFYGSSLISGTLRVLNRSVLFFSYRSQEGVPCCSIAVNDLPTGKKLT